MSLHRRAIISATSESDLAFSRQHVAPEMLCTCMHHGSRPSFESPDGKRQMQHGSETCDIAALKAKRVAQAQAMQKQRQAKLAADKERQAQAKAKAQQTRLDRAAEKAAAAAGDASDHHWHGVAADGDDLHRNAAAQQHLNGNVADHLGAPLQLHHHTNGSVHARQPQTGVSGQWHGNNQYQQLQPAQASGNPMLSPSMGVDTMPYPVQGRIPEEPQLPAGQPDARAVAPHSPKPQSRSLQEVLQRPSVADSSALALLRSAEDSSAPQAAAVGPAAPAVAPMMPQAEDNFDWAAWQDDMGSGIVERLATRERRPPKRPYTVDDDQPKPKARKMGAKLYRERSVPKHVRYGGPAHVIPHMYQPYM